MSSHHGFNLHFFNFARAGVSFSCIYFNSTLSPFPLFMACVPAFSWRVLFLLIAGTLEQAVPSFLTRRQCFQGGHFLSVLFLLFSLPPCRRLPFFRVQLRRFFLHDFCLMLRKAVLVPRFIFLSHVSSSARVTLESRVCDLLLLWR